MEVQEVWQRRYSLKGVTFLQHLAPVLHSACSGAGHYYVQCANEQIKVRYLHQMKLQMCWVLVGFVLLSMMLFYSSWGRKKFAIQESWATWVLADLLLNKCWITTPLLKLYIGGVFILQKANNKNYKKNVFVMKMWNRQVILLGPSQKLYRG